MPRSRPRSGRASPMTELAPYAACDAASRGRQHGEPRPPMRSEFQRDRDRIVHSTAFRRLEYKTQVFVNHEGDLFRTRLTHSIEVAQIARGVCRSLRLNEDLAEAVALAHDLGHTPFGHAGQDALNACMREHGGFAKPAHRRSAGRALRRVRRTQPDIRDPRGHRQALLSRKRPQAGRSGAAVPGRGEAVT